MKKIISYLSSRILNNNKIIHILTPLQTIEYILKSNVSVCRFGDGEFSIIKGSKGPTFQASNNRLATRLKEILTSDEKSILICIPYALLKEGRDTMRLSSQMFWKNFSNKLPYSTYKLIYDKNFGDSLITRPYMDFVKNNKNLISAEIIFNKLKKLWFKKKILIIEGESSKLGVGNDLFSSCESIQRIICPSKNAWNSYEKILNLSLSLGKQFDLILIALGPTATVLAYDLGLKSLRSIDIGHLDIEYEWFNQRATEKQAIKNKHVNEVKNLNTHTTTLSEQDLRKYKKEIIATIN